MAKYIIKTNEADIQSIIDRIDGELGFPNSKANTVADIYPHPDALKYSGYFSSRYESYLTTEELEDCVDNLPSDWYPDLD